jgi:hypothetical protein
VKQVPGIAEIATLHEKSRPVHTTERLEVVYKY